MESLVLITDVPFDLKLQATRKEQEDKKVPLRACGALVHAIEDEVAAIRLGALKVFSSQDYTFAANLALDCLTDDCRTVRLEALKCLNSMLNMKDKLVSTIKDRQEVYPFLLDSHEETRKQAFFLLMKIDTPLEEIYAFLCAAGSKFDFEGEDGPLILGLAAKVGQQSKHINLPLNGSIEDAGHRLNYILTANICHVNNTLPLRLDVFKREFAYFAVRFRQYIPQKLLQKML